MIKEIEALLLPFPEKVSVYCGFGILPGRSSHRPQVYLEVFRLIGFFGGNSIWFLLMGASLPLLYPRRDSLHLDCQRANFLALQRKFRAKPCSS